MPAVQSLEETHGYWTWSYFSLNLRLPIIAFDLSFFRLEPLLQELAFRTACLKLQINTEDPETPLCAALAELRRQGLSARDEAVIAGAHLRLGRLRRYFGGVGSEYWRRTMIRCPRPP